MSTLRRRAGSLARQLGLIPTTAVEDPTIVAKRDAVWADIARRQPKFVEAVLADARYAMANRGDGPAARFRLEKRQPTNIELARYAVWLCWKSEAFYGQVAYRARIALKNRGVPILPQILNRVSVSSAQISIGDPVVMEPGVFIAHGQTVIDGIVIIRTGSCIFPWTTIGLKAGNMYGPTIERNVRVGTGAKLLGPYHIGMNAQIGSNAVVTRDVKRGEIVVGIPARPIVPKATSMTADESSIIEESNDRHPA